MKKLLLVGVISLALGVSGAFAQHPSGFGIGAQGGWSGGVGGGLTLHIPSVPIFWTVDVDLGGLGVAGDFYIFDQPLVPAAKLGWYLGGGAYGYFGVWGDEVAIAAGARLPIGLSWQPLDFLEVYLQVVPSIGLQILPGIGLWPNFFGGNLGIRVWL
jgi:hypothetical protein